MCCLRGRGSIEAPESFGMPLLDAGERGDFRTKCPHNIKMAEEGIISLPKVPAPAKAKAGKAPVAPGSKVIYLGQ